MPKISGITSVQEIIKLLIQYGLSEAVLSPGSRNAPFLISFDAIDSFNCESVVDERVAAFVALGKAQQVGKPVVLCCTSGSAMLNYAPAIAEAYYQNVPLVIITADRPRQWIDKGEGQSIRQMEVINGIVGGQVEWQADLDVETNKKAISELLMQSIQLKTPIQINVPLDEPLYETQEAELHVPPAELTATEAADERGLFKTDFEQAKRILIICAQGFEQQLVHGHVLRLNEDPRVAVMTETTANLAKLGFVCCIDRTLAVISGLDAGYLPDMVITIGENIISKRLKHYIRKHKEGLKVHWHFGLKPMNVFDVSNYHHAKQAKPSLASIQKLKVNVRSNFKTKWQGAFFRGEMLHGQILERVAYSDLKTFELLIDFIPDGWQVQMGNSSVVRYFQLFNQLADVSYFGNRGVSGIDGCTSTAIGAAKVSKMPVLFVSGDHAFRYDSNALSVSEIPNNLRIIVINNDGGNIFRIIDGPRDQAANDQFIEHHKHKSIKGLVEHHGLEYRRAEDMDSLERNLKRLFDLNHHTPVVLEIFTPRVGSPEILRSYFEQLGKTDN